MLGEYGTSPLFVDDAYDLSDLAGKASVLRFTYATDPGSAKAGWFIDDVKVKAGDRVIYSSDFESSSDNAIFNGGCREDLQTATVCTKGWQYTSAVDGSPADHAYYLELRDRAGFDADGHGEDDRATEDDPPGPNFEPGVSLVYTDENHGYGNVGTDDPPAQSPAGRQARAGVGHAEPRRRGLHRRRGPQHVLGRRAGAGRQLPEPERPGRQLDVQLRLPVLQGQPHGRRRGRPDHGAGRPHRATSASTPARAAARSTSATRRGPTRPPCRGRRPARPPRASSARPTPSTPACAAKGGRRVRLITKGGGKIVVRRVATARRPVKPKVVLRGSVRKIRRLPRRNGLYVVSVKGRRIVVRRAHGRFKVRPDYRRGKSCGILKTFRLASPGFGKRGLRGSYSVAQAATVGVTVLRGKKVVKTLRPRARTAGKTFRLRLKAKRRGEYTVVLAVKGRSRTANARLVLPPPLERVTGSPASRATSAAYAPPAASSSSCVPRSTISPWSRTTIWSASRTVERRCAMTIVVRPVASSRSASSTARSVWTSSALVASSSSRTGGLRRIVRAIAMRCFSPPEKRKPRSPTTVS